MNPQLIFSDFDGTLTDGESLTQNFWNILNLLDSRKLPLVIVTGRSVQWSYFTLTHFPSLTYSIAEGGGVWVERVGHELKTHLMISTQEQEKLRTITSELEARFPVSLSSDSSGRLCDRAIELSDLKEASLKSEIEAFLSEQGAHFSSSNVHLNFWVGAFTKASTMKHLLKKRFPKHALRDCLFFGDSLNDESVFEEFPETVGVKNIENVWSRLKFHPKHKAPEAGALGVLSFLQNHFSQSGA